MRTCQKCKKGRPLSEFHKNKNKNLGLSTWCKSCANENAKKWSNNNKDRARDSRFRAAYGISLFDYKKMLSRQGGLCAVCRRPSTQIDKRTGNPRWLAVDHDHDTGKVRGILCRNCNYWLGCIDEDAAIAINMANYIIEHMGAL